jgi:hypothetical protein
MRYEDFVTAPRELVSQILSVARLGPATAPFVANDTVELMPTHSVAGNPTRFTTGVVQIRADDEWRTAMPPPDRRVVERVTGRVMRRYGYLGSPR